MISGATLALLIVLSTHAGLAQQPAPAVPKLQATVSLERTWFRAGDSVPFQVWLANDSDFGIESVELALAGPDFIWIESGDCKAPGARGKLHLGAIPARDVIHQQGCLRLGQEIGEGKFSLSYVFEVRWSQGVSPHASYVVVEKAADVGVLGTETVSGVSLSLLAFVLPGLLAFILLPLLNVPGTTGLGTAEKAALSVIVSCLLIALTAQFWPTETVRGMSVPRLLLLCAIAIALALLSGLVAWGVRRLIEVNRAKRIALPTDSEAQVLSRLFAGSGRARSFRNVWVRKDDGTELLGSALVPMADGSMLIGWFQIDPGSDQVLRARLTHLQNKGRWNKLLQAAQKAGLDPQMRDAIKQKDAGGQWGTTAIKRMALREKEIEFSSESRAEQPPPGPLSLA